MLSISSAFIIISMLIMTGSPPRMLIMMTPAIAGLATMLCVHVLFDIPLNVTSVIAAIVVLGLCIDYGVFTVHAYEEGNTTLWRHGCRASVIPDHAHRNVCAALCETSGSLI